MTNPKSVILSLDDLLVGLTYYFATTVVVVLGILFGTYFVRQPGDGEVEVPGTFLERFLRFDGLHYQRICVEGYSYNPNDRSDVAFFPAYPLAARAVMQLTGCASDVALIAVANGALALAFVLLAAYVRHRNSTAPPELRHLTLLAFGIFPTTFFFRMAYSEGLFLALTLASMIAIERRANLVLIAVLVGLTTASRPVGIALLPVFALYLWRRSTCSRNFALTGLLFIPLSCWGLLAFILYQWYVFDEPLAFIKTQAYWSRVPPVALIDRAACLITLKPIWGTFDPGSPYFWARAEIHKNALFSLYLANAILFLFATALVAIGSFKNYLTTYEAILAIGLLLIPYVSKGYENGLASGGRFVAAIIPLYLVLAQLVGGNGKNDGVPTLVEG
jgi:hypothetical protein